MPLPTRFLACTSWRPGNGVFGDLRGTAPAYSEFMHATFLQKVVLTIICALFASGLVEFYKNFVQKADIEINRDWRGAPTASPHH